MTASLNVLFGSVTKGSGKLYDGLPALSLDGQVLAAAITAHLARLAIPAPRALRRGLCAAAGLCMKRAAGVLCTKTEGLRTQAGAIGAAVEQSSWCVMRNGLPEGCRAPLSPTCRWRRRAHCRHQDGRLCLGGPPWQPKGANAAVAAPGRDRGSRSASSVPVLEFAAVSAAAPLWLSRLLLLSPRRFAAPFA